MPIIIAGLFDKEKYYTGKLIKLRYPEYENVFKKAFGKFYTIHLRRMNGIFTTVKKKNGNYQMERLNYG